MTRRITIPEDHVALILSAQLADELMSLMQAVRRESARLHARKPEQGYNERVNVAGDLMLALLEAKES